MRVGLETESRLMEGLGLEAAARGSARLSVCGRKRRRREREGEREREREREREKERRFQVTCAGYHYFHDNHKNLLS